MTKVKKDLEMIFKRVGDWNAQRYSRKYNQQLTSKLLNEEHQEYFDAITRVDKLDALCDVCYVAMGGLWKLGINDVFSNNDTYLFGNILRGIKNSEIMLKVIIATAIELAETDLGITQETFVKAMTIVCDANDTKTAPQSLVDSNVKANINKGKGFVPPEARLAKLLRETS
tara:strand:+ start:9067 stop:9579 length:513 start_codon:yes stop_codon:yes gene_type:complete